MNTPSLDQWINAEYPQLVAAYTAAWGHAPDHQWAAFQTYRRFMEPAVWPFDRMLAWERSQNGQTQPVAPGPVVPAAVDALTIDGAYFLRAGHLHRRKSITAFTLPKRFAEGRGDDASRFMDWAVSLGYNEFRCFSRVDWNGTSKGVEPGFAFDPTACAQVFTEAAARGCYVELVAHTYREDLTPMVDHLRAVDALCGQHVNALLEVSNEPPVNGIPLQDLLNRYTPRTLWASGQYDPTPHPAGRWVNTHTDRKPEWPRCFKDAVEFGTGDGPYQPFTPAFLGPVMLDEPPQVERTADVEDWKAYGAGAALFAAGATMHSNPSLQRCEIPTDPAVLACCRAFIEGLDLVPLQRYHGYAHPDDRGSLRRYQRRGEDGKIYEISVRPFAFGAV